MRSIFKPFVQIMYSILVVLFFIMNFSLYIDNLVLNNNGMYKESTILVVSSTNESENQIDSVKNNIFKDIQIQDLLITFKALNKLDIGIGVYDKESRLVGNTLDHGNIMIRQSSFLDTLSSNNHKILYLNNANIVGTYSADAFFLSTFDYIYSLMDSETLNGTYTITDYSSEISSLDIVVNTFEDNNYYVTRYQTSLSILGFISNNKGLIIFYVLFIFVHLFMVSNEIYFAKKEKEHSQIFYLLGASPMQVYRRSIITDLLYKSLSTCVAMILYFTLIQPMLSTFFDKSVSFWLYFVVAFISVLIPFVMSLIIRFYYILRFNYASVSEEVK